MLLRSELRGCYEVVVRRSMTVYARHKQISFGGREETALYRGLQFGHQNQEDSKLCNGSRTPHRATLVGKLRPLTNGLLPKLCVYYRLFMTISLDLQGFIGFIISNIFFKRKKIIFYVLQNCQEKLRTACHRNIILIN